MLTYFDLQGRIDFYDYNNDDGTRTVADIDQANSEAWSQHVVQYGANGIVQQDYFLL